ncbi:Putative leucine aminopeptidase 1 [Verticillium dahliae VDG1]|nr:Putative leucine aminopeptidase 1 [Verticillium dahliae VDG1]
MADYNSMKVPELKKLLQTRSLSVTGNKADLVARLAENDKQNAPKPEAPKENFALNLNATDPSEETKKRAERAKRFGITADDSADTEAKKKAERAARFGADSNDIASSLDAALPERRPKRGRGEGDQQQGGQDAKRQNAANGGRRGRGRQQGQREQQQGGRRQPPPRENAGRKQGGGGRVIDPAEKAKLEARAKRFAAS